MRKKVELIFSSIWLATAIFYLYLAIERLFSHSKFMGQGWFPILIGIFFVISSFCIVWQAVRINKEETVSFSWQKLIVIIASSVVLVFVVRQWGIVIASFIYSLAMMLFLKYNWKKSLVAAVVIALFTYVMFIRLVTIVFR